MCSKYSMIVCLIIVICFIQNFVNCEWRVDFGSTVNHGAHVKKQHQGHETRKQQGGHEKGKEDWENDAYLKHMREWGNFGEQDNAKHDQHGGKHHKKHELGKHADKWGHNHGDFTKHKMDEWKSEEKWGRNKGNGYVKKWSWEKEYGENNAHGTKESRADQQFKKSHEHKEGMHKHKDKHDKKHGYKKHSIGKIWIDHGKKHSGKGENSHGHKSWREKKPEYQEYQKILKKKSSQKKPQRHKMGYKNEGDHEHHEDDHQE